ncbi:hypothetical protein V6N13_079359 [Hibiscus sabdariffa]|uniref:60S ribosomal protein L13 n=1 Tax=Hibiscus sabdariffa TaxID=183260 RepID=A0ABR2RRG5_9ROSI
MSSPTGSTSGRLSRESRCVGKPIRRRTRASMRTPLTLAQSVAIMLVFLSLTTSVEIAVGKGIPNAFDVSSPTVLIVEGMLEAIWAGILIYTTMVDLLAADFMNPSFQNNGILQTSTSVSLLIGSAFIGKPTTIEREKKNPNKVAKSLNFLLRRSPFLSTVSITLKGKPWLSITTKARRRTARQKKAVRIFPRPTAGPLRPIVHGQTLKYNMKLRAGRGFTLEELKAAGISKKLAPTIGIAVDHRRKNRSLEGLQTNVQRLKTYKAKLVVFPRRARKFKAGDSTAEELATATQVQGSFMPISREKPSAELVKVTEEMKSFKAYNKLRVERMNERHIGARLKKAAEAEKEDKK